MRFYINSRIFLYVSNHDKMFEQRHGKVKWTRNISFINIKLIIDPYPRRKVIVLVCNTHLVKQGNTIHYRK
jgi:hypothetical protein